MLDSFAVLAFLGRVRGFGKVRDLLRDAARSDEPLLMNEINSGEVYYVTARERSFESAEAFLNRLELLRIRAVPSSFPKVLEAAKIKAPILHLLRPRLRHPWSRGPRTSARPRIWSPWSAVTRWAAGATARLGRRKPYGTLPGVAGKLTMKSRALVLVRWRMTRPSGRLVKTRRCIPLSAVWSIMRACWRSKFSWM